MLSALVVVALIVPAGCSAPDAVFRRVPWQAQHACGHAWSLSPTLGRGDRSLVAARDASGSRRSASLLQLRRKDVETACLRLPWVRVAALLWSRRALLVFAVALAGEPPADEGRFAVPASQLPALFALRIDEASGAIAASARVPSLDGLVWPVGAATLPGEAAVVLHVQAWARSVADASCFGPAPHYHSLLLNVSDMTVAGACLDAACGLDRHCNYSGANPALEPDLDAGRLSGWPLAVVVGILTLFMVATAGLAVAS